MLLLLAAATLLSICPAAPPSSMDEFLSPNTAVFIGNIAQTDGNKPVYQVSEMLWGELPGRVRYGRPDLRMYAVHLDGQGNPIPGCEADWLPLNHEWITDIRRVLQIKLPANLTIWVRNGAAGEANLAGVDVTLVSANGGKQYRGVTGVDGRFELPSPIPPGAYRIQAKKAGYETADESVAVVPGGGGFARVLLSPLKDSQRN